MISRVLLLTIFLTCLVAGIQAGPQSSDSPSDADRKFIVDAARAGIAEVKLAKLARDRGAHPDVREFAQTLVDDHTAANKELTSLGDRKKVTLPEKMDDKHQDLYDKLSKLMGDEFDREYLTRMAADHVTAVAKFQAQSKHSSDTDVTTFAVKTLPTLEKHLATSRELADKYKK